MNDQETLRHSCAHVLATAILRIWPEAQFAAGPPVEGGFYYDVELAHRISPEDFAKIEEEMRRVVAEDQKFERRVVTRAEAVELGRAGKLAALGEYWLTRLDARSAAAAHDALIGAGRLDAFVHLRP